MEGAIMVNGAVALAMKQAVAKILKQPVEALSDHTPLTEHQVSLATFLFVLNGGEHFPDLGPGEFKSLTVATMVQSLKPLTEAPRFHR